YKQREGHCRVSQAFKTVDGFGLGQWATHKRKIKDRLSPERRQKLDELGFGWDRIDLEQRWERGLIQLRAYKQREGHCRVPQHFKTADGFQLGLWVHGRRQKKDQMSSERRQQLDDLGFVWKTK